MPLLPSKTLYPSKTLFPMVRTPEPGTGQVDGLSSGSPSIPKLRVPLRLEGGHLATVEQDSQENVDACVYTILSYEVGSRIEDPDFGIEDPTFEQLPLDLGEWLTQIARYEPRAEVETAQEIEEVFGRVLVGVGP